LAVYSRHSHYLINNVVTADALTFGVSELPVRAIHDRKADGLVGKYLDEIAAGKSTLMPLPEALHDVVHEGTGHSPLNEPAKRWIDATKRQAQAQQQREHYLETGQRAEAQQAKAEVKQAAAERNAAWAQIKESLDEAMPTLFKEMEWHTDMAHDALMQLPTVGSPEHPVVVYRGDWTTRVHSLAYGSKYYPHGVALNFQSVSRSLNVAAQFMAHNPSDGQKVLVAYRLTGKHARDISAFSWFGSSEEEAIFPPGAWATRVEDPALVEQIRNGLPEEYRDSCQIIVMEER
jgi:hypothetical protein